MELYPNKIHPKDVFVTALDANEQPNPDNPKEKTRLSGNEFIDTLVNLFVVYKKPNQYFCAKKMEISTDLFQQLMLLYTGLRFGDWCSEYTMLCAKELLVKTDYTLDAIGKRVGFSDITSFSKWFTAIQKEAPSYWRKERRKNYLEEEKALFEEWKKIRNA